MSSKTAPEVPVRWSLAARLTAWYAGAAFVLILGTTAFLYWALVSNLDREDDEFLADKVHILRLVLRERPDDLKALKQEVEWQATGRPTAHIRVRVLDENGTILLETPGMSAELAPGVFPVPGAVDAVPGRGTEARTPAGKSFRILAVRAGLGQDVGPTRVLQVAFDRTYEEDLLASYRRNFWLVLATALLLSALTGYQIARRGLRPLAEITETARRIRSTTLDERLTLSHLPAELSVLAATFNEMLDRLEESFQRLARFSADIAHELRTPVNNLRGEAEVALGKPRPPEEYREVLGSSLEECGRLARLIDSLLFLARADSPETQITRERVDVGRELATVREFYEAAASEAGIRLTVASSQAVTADLDCTLFQRAVGNLVANALAHTPSGGSVTLAAARDGDTVRVEVTDTGSGISAEHVPHVFDRFYRVDQARSTGSGRVGLGLAIVKGIASLHRGSAAIASEVGRGTRVTLTFPRADRAFSGEPEATGAPRSPPAPR